MAALILAVAVAMAGASPPPDPVARWDREIAAASARFGIPAAWIRVVMRIESGGRALQNGAPIRSRAGAMGLMQLMPSTWRDLRARYALGTDPDDPGDNILAGTAYLRWLYDRFGYPGLFIAYNAGPGRYLAWRDRGAALPAETEAYRRVSLRALGEPAEPALSTGAAALPTDIGWRTLFVPLAGARPAGSDPQ